MFKKFLNEEVVEEKYSNFIEIKNTLFDFYQNGKIVKNQLILEAFSDRKTAIVFNMAKWKRKYLCSFLPEYRLIFVKNDFNPKVLEFIIKFIKNKEFIVWGRTVSPALNYFSSQYNIKINHIEDGFIRSVGLGANHILGYSLCFDKTGIYYDSTQPSDLENLLNTFDFSDQYELLERSKKLIQEIKHNSISKYNLILKNDVDVLKLYGIKNRKRILVIGQVENDQSLIYGCDHIMTNLNFIEQVILENPDAQIIYKPHPDVISGKRKELSNFDSIKNKIDILNIDIPLSVSLKTIDHVYTMTSLAGFEALLYDIPVTTFGAPFYSNWGLTDDRQIISRRKRKLKIEELFAIAYILYPRYVSADYLSKSDIEEVIDTIKKNKKHALNESMLDDASLFTRFYNLQTKHPVDYEYINNSASQKKVIISDNVNIESIISKVDASNLDILFLSEKLANDNQFYVKPIFEKYQINAISKKYSTTFSDLEYRSTTDCKIFSSILLRNLKLYVDDLIPFSVLRELCEGVEDYIYNDILKFNSYYEILLEYDQIYLDLNSLDENKETILGLIYHSEKTDSLNKINISFSKSKMSRDFVRNYNPKSFSIDLDGHDVGFDVFKKIYWDIVQNPVKQVQRDNILICGNIAERNYAYSPSTMKLLKTLANKDTVDNIIFVNSGIFNQLQFEECKKYIFEENLSNKVSVYDSAPIFYKERYSQVFDELESFLTKNFYSHYLSELRTQLPENLIFILKDRIKAFMKALTSQFILIGELSRVINNTQCFYTSMERSSVSRAITAICKHKNVETVGIQPQVISTSPRYKKLIVDKMGVIDSNQGQIFKSLGSNAKVDYVGSVNIYERLMMLEKHHKLIKKDSVFTVFFAMQHSLKSEMEFVFESLLYILKNNPNIRILIKPHPHQEKPLIDRVYKLFADFSQVKILTPSSDTYEYLAKSHIVLGVFSSVLLEAGIFGMPVIVMHKNPLNDSINFAKLGLAIEVQDHINLSNVLNDLEFKGNSWKALQSSQKQYLIKNPQFLPPYSAKKLEDFISNSCI